MKWMFAAIVLATAMISTALLWTVEYGRVSSPDGKYVAVAKFRNYKSCRFMMPGGSSDKEGWISIFTRNGKKIGEVDGLAMQMLGDVEWGPNAVRVGNEILKL